MRDGQFSIKFLLRQMALLGVLFGFYRYRVEYWQLLHSHWLLPCVIAQMLLAMIAGAVLGAFIGGFVPMLQVEGGAIFGMLAVTVIASVAIALNLIWLMNAG